MKLRNYFIWFLMILATGSFFVLPLQTEENKIQQEVFKGELISYPGPYAFGLGSSCIILVNDQDLEDICDPDKKIDMSTSHNKQISSLRDICEGAKQQGNKTLIIAFDYFFKQYRPGQDTPRKLMPDMDEYIQKIAKISKFAEQYGLGLELSLLSPLEIGPSFSQRTGESGKWMHYRKSIRDPKSGAYSVELWRQKQWANNKGALNIEDAGIRVFAFKEQAIGGTPYIYVDPKSIVEISQTAKVEKREAMLSDRGDYKAERVRIYGEGATTIGPLDRVLVVQIYKTPEMDYFSPNALPFLNTLLDKYVDAGVKLNAMYSDEMHIQQDWGYFDHHDNGEFALRYVSDGLAKTYANLYGKDYEDFAKYLIYFTEGQEDYRNDLVAKLPLMHVWGASPEEIRKTALFRARYNQLLQDSVVDLFTKAKHHAEERYGKMLYSRAHATWAESPTIDQWNGGEGHSYKRNYEYTSDFLYSNTIHQIAAACQDYFKWGDYLTGNGNDHCECGWLDRNYTGLALACSTGVINKIPYSYGAHWGMPDEISRRRSNLVDAFGASSEPFFAAVQDMQHREVDVLTLYPIDLAAVDQHFGSWMTQYAYTNYITQSKLIEMGDVKDGKIHIAGCNYSTLFVAFEPFPTKKMMAMIKTFAETGGKVIWSGPVPVLSREGEPILEEWETIFGVDYTPARNEGVIAVGKKVQFSGILEKVEPQIIMTHFLMDHIYPVTPKEGTQPVANVQNQVVGAYKKLDKGGSATFLGFRPRDDQAQSLGYEIRTMFDILSSLGAYPSTGKFSGCNDNTEYISRTTDLLTCRFPNGTIAIAPHLKTVEENWPGGFARIPEEDKKIMEKLAVPSEALHLQDMKVDGVTVSFNGNRCVAFRLDEKENLLAFSGFDCKEITLNGKKFSLAENPFGLISFAPAPKERRVEGGAVYQVFVYGTGELHLPIAGLLDTVKCFAQGVIPGSRGEKVESSCQDGILKLQITPASQGRWIFVVEK